MQRWRPMSDHRRSYVLCAWMMYDIAFLFLLWISLRIPWRHCYYSHCRHKANYIAVSDSFIDLALNLASSITRTSPLNPESVLYINISKDIIHNSLLLHIEKWLFFITLETMHYYSWKWSFCSCGIFYRRKSGSLVHYAKRQTQISWSRIYCSVMALLSRSHWNRFSEEYIDFLLVAYWDIFFK